MNQKMTARANKKQFCLDLVDIRQNHLLSDCFIKFKPYWEDFQKRKKEEEKFKSENEKREALWRSLNDLKKQIESCYNERYIDSLKHSITRKLNDVKEHADYLCSQQNATGLSIRKLEEYLEEDVFDKSYADLYVSKFIERIFCELIHSESRFRKIENIVDRIGPIESDADSTIAGLKKEVSIITKLNDKSNHYCSTCWKIKQTYDTSCFEWLPYIYGNTCKYKKDGEPCSPKQVQSMSEELTASVVERIKQKIKELEKYEFEAENYLIEIKKQLPFYVIVPNYKRIGIAVGIFVLLITLLIII